MRGSTRLFVLSGAGCSTRSGIPDYRDESGAWKRKEPVRYQQFISGAEVRKRYWARSLVGWRLVDRAEPNDAHHVLASLEADGPVHYVLTQNVDGLHQKAGSRVVNDLHGRIDRVACLDCSASTSRHAFQQRLAADNPSFDALTAHYAPDGDADLDVDFSAFCTPNCLSCGGTLKPDVVFFGESVPKPRVAEAMEAVDDSDAMLVVGTSLMVWSGYRFVKRAVEREIPVAAVNLGTTRADDDLTVKLEADCVEALPALAARLR